MRLKNGRQDLRHVSTTSNQLIDAVTPSRHTSQRLTQAINVCTMATYTVQTGLLLQQPQLALVVFIFLSMSVAMLKMPRVGWSQAAHLPVLVLCLQATSSHRGRQVSWVRHIETCQLSATRAKARQATEKLGDTSSVNSGMGLPMC